LSRREGVEAGNRNKGRVPYVYMIETKFWWKG